MDTNGMRVMKSRITAIESTQQRMHTLKVCGWERLDSAGDDVDCGKGVCSCKG